MDYKRIYSEFIADRKGKPKPEGYTERHHILPRSLGGGNEPENLIDLTAEDHFFAHLLLAKIHGGRMWAPIALMIGGQRKDWRPRKSRRSYGWAARAMAATKMGEGAHQFDWKEYYLVHVDGRTWNGRQSDMPSLGLSKSLANMLIKGRVGSARGWFIAGRRPPHFGQGAKPGLDHNMADRRVHRFRNIDGRLFVGTQIEFQRAEGVPSRNCSSLVRGERMITKGWHIDGITPKRTGRAGTYFRNG